MCVGDRTGRASQGGGGHSSIPLEIDIRSESIRFLLLPNAPDVALRVGVLQAREGRRSSSALYHRRCLPRLGIKQDGLKRWRPLRSLVGIRVAIVVSGPLGCWPVSYAVAAAAVALLHSWACGCRGRRRLAALLAACVMGGCWIERHVIGYHRATLAYVCTFRCVCVCVLWGTALQEFIDAGNRGRHPGSFDELFGQPGVAARRSRVDFNCILT